MKTGRFAFSILGLVGCACMAGCELVAGIEQLSLTDSGAGAESSTDDGPATVDGGGNDAADGTVPADGQTEGGGDDGPGTRDGASPKDGGNTGDAPSTSGFCASQATAPTFCQDFDEFPLPGGFSGESSMNGSLTLTDASVVSPPKALAAQDNAIQSGALDTALRNFFPSLPGTPTLFTLDFEIEPVGVDPGSAAALVAASLDFADAANNRYSVQFTLFQQGASGMVGIRLEEQAEFADGGTFYQSHMFPESLPIGGWTEVILKLNRSGPTSATATVDFGATQVLNAAPLTMNVNATSLTLTIGSAYESLPSAGWTTRYDNVLLNIGP